MGVFVATMANQLSTGHKSHVTVCAFVRTGSCKKQNSFVIGLLGLVLVLLQSLRGFLRTLWCDGHTSVCVEVVAEQGDRSEGSATQVTFMGPFVSVAFHVSVQV